MLLSKTSGDQVILVDRNDQPLGTAPKLEAHQKALCHRAFSVFVIRQSLAGIEVLLQQRQHDKYHSRGLWTNTCCSHPHPGDKTQEAAERRLVEEMGIHLTLRPIGVFHYEALLDTGLTEHEVDHVLVGSYDGQNFTINPNEVADYRWITIEALQADLEKQPKSYTPWLLPALHILIAFFKDDSHAAF